MKIKKAVFIVFIFPLVVFGEPNNNIGRYQFLRFDSEHKGPTDSASFGKFDTVTGKMWVYNQVSLKDPSGSMLETNTWVEVTNSARKYDAKTGIVSDLPINK